MRHKKQKPPICIGGSERLCAADVPPLHERTFPRSLPRKRGRCREAIGMGFAHHYFVAHLHCGIITAIRQYQKSKCNFGIADDFEVDGDTRFLDTSRSEPRKSRSMRASPCSHQPVVPTLAACCDSHEI